jgi:prepilin-type N-terminal cleavage/methylation domain-containing protein
MILPKETKQKNKLSRKYWFTLIELIIVITILAILSTIWYISYNWYISQSRDSVRVSQVSSIISAMEACRMKWSIPIPDDKITVYASWEIIWYQWYAGKNVLSIVWYEEWWKDPLSWKYFTYFANFKQRKRSVLALLENGIDTNDNTIDERMPVSYWNKVWIILDVNNQPIQDNVDLKTTWLDVKTTTETYNVYFSDTENISWTWELLQVLYWTATTWIIWETCDDYIEENAWYFLKPWYFLMNLNWSLEKQYCDMIYWYCRWSIPENGVSNALSLDWWIRNYNEINWNCTFICPTNYTWNGTICEADSQTAVCEWSLPTSAIWNTSGNYIQVWDWTAFTPTNKTANYNEIASNNDCRFKCNTNYTWNWTNCVANTQRYTCAAKPAIWTVWNTVSSYEQAWNGTLWTPADTLTVYNTTPSTTACNYTCDTGYSWNWTTCVICESWWTMTAWICYKTISSPKVNLHTIWVWVWYNLSETSWLFYCNDFVRGWSLYYTASTYSIVIFGIYEYKYLSSNSWNSNTVIFFPSATWVTSITCKYTP